MYLIIKPLNMTSSVNLILRQVKLSTLGVNGGENTTNPMMALTTSSSSSAITFVFMCFT